MLINNVIFNVDLLTILNELVTELRMNDIPLIRKYKDGPTHVQLCCPYHNAGMERRPSAGIRKSDGMFHCFACREVHKLPEVISHCFGHDSDVLGKFGWEWLLKNFATVQIEERKDVDLDYVRNTTNTNRVAVRTGADKSKVADVARGTFVSEEELERYRVIHPYMYERKLTDAVIELFDIGYDIDDKTITFPIKNLKGDVLFIARRRVDSKYYHYPSGVMKPLYGAYELTTLKPFPQEVIVCEGMFDALTCWVYGKPAVALNGLGNDLQFAQLRKMPCRKLILATDNDDPGMTARKRIRANIKNTKLVSEYILPANRKDINDLTKDEFLNLLEVF